jgi:manganese/zinc/iron transport system substrate-binding protein
MTHRILILCLSITAALAAGCRDFATSADGKLKVVATTGMIADAAWEIGGDHVHVETLMGPGIDPHRYAPTAGDLSRLSAARVVFFNGLHLEGKMTDVLEKPRAGQTAVGIADRLDPAKLRKADGADGPHDPHVWMDPMLWADCVRAVGEALKEADPAHAAEYDARTAQYQAKLAKLHEDNLKLVSAIPKAKRILVTSHDAFEYFGAAYGFEVRGLQGVSTVSETSTKDVTEMAEFLGSKRVPAVFTETSVPPKGLEAVLDSVRMKYGHTVKLIGGDDALYSDALGAPGTTGETYVGMIRHNMTVIVNGLK